MQFFDSNGDPLASGKVYTYESGTTTNKATYTDQAAGTPHANPVILDSAGRAQIWISGSYKFVIKDSSDATIDTTDVVSAFATSAGGSVDDIINDFTEDTIVAADSVIFSDASDSGATKRDTVQGIIDLAGGGILPLSTKTSGRILRPLWATTIDSSTGFTVTADRLYVMPISFGGGVSIDRITVGVVTGAGNAYMGLYNLDGDGKPTTLVTDYGTIDVSTSGEKSITISETLTSGYYGLGIVFSGTPAVYTGASSSGNIADLLLNGVIFGGNNSTSFPMGRYMSHTYGALPSTFTEAGTLGNPANIPYVFTRVS